MNPWSSLLAGLTLATAAAAAGAANDVVLSPLASIVAPGSAFQLQVRGADFASVMLGGGLDLRWDPSVVALTGVVIDDTVWETARFEGTLDAASGTLGGLYFASFAGRSGAFAIATLDFVAAAPGSAPIVLGAYDRVPFVDEDGRGVDITLGAVQVTVSAVPEPAGWLLGLLGGSGLLLTRRRAVTVW